MTFSNKVKQAEKLLSQYIYSRLTHAPLTNKDIPQIVEEFRPILSGDLYQLKPVDFDYLIKSLETQWVTTMEAGVSLIDTNDLHNDEWYLKHEIEWNYWEDYERQLINESWPSRVVSSMDKISNKILGLLQDPNTDGGWCRKGLVLGHVQSGKTANYIGLISKAADAGYKFIIVIAGIHNNLRTQTQARIDEGFIGRDSDTKQPIGVGILNPKRAMPVTVTTTKSDFNKALAKSFGMQLESLNKTFILVIKKNVTTLSNLYNWLKELNTHDKRDKITDIPMLLIDDEADNASINTNKPEIDPTRTNQEIRNIINLFRKRCYVGYTATPFANIFINPDSESEMLGADLFPKDFIYCLDAPTNYFGSEKLFLDDSCAKKFNREINDAEERIPLRHKNHDPINELPQTLMKAIRVFILSRSIRNIRGDANKHSSMMVNVSRFVATQRQVKELIEFYLDDLKKAVRFNYKLPADKALANSFISQLFDDFCDEYKNSNVEWEAVFSELNIAADATRVILVNSKSDESLDYNAYAKEGNALTVIAIGGLSLSRGLTIEGLTISYIYRNSKMYDTLMQMGRWFGYREKYEDLCRVYMSEESYGWYSHISEATEELRMQIKRMRREGKKPSDFGLYVRAHPDTLIVTALNKMHYTENKKFKISYDGKLIETHIIPDSEEKNRRNRELFKSFFEEMSKLVKPHEDKTASYLFTNISWETVSNFLLCFSFHNDMVDLSESVPQFIKEISDLYPKWDVAFKSVKAQKRENGFMIGAQVRDIGHTHSGEPKRPVSEKGWHVGNKNRFSGNSMFAIGLNDHCNQKAQQLAKEAGRQNPIFSDYTNARDKPILLLHLLNLIDKKEGDRPVINLVPAISISFPNSSEFRTVEYVVSPIWLKQFEQEKYDSPDEEEDYDLE